MRPAAPTTTSFMSLMPLMRLPLALPAVRLFVVCQAQGRLQIVERA
jgi:hypothetical protein